MCQSRHNAPQQAASLLDHLVGEREHLREISMPSVFAVSLLMISASLVGRLTGRSAGSAPLDIFPIQTPLGDAAGTLVPQPVRPPPATSTDMSAGAQQPTGNYCKVTKVALTIINAPKG
jgi:hypothetical protein